MKKFLCFSALLALLASCSPQAEQVAKVFGRYVPERKDDFAWENEYAAFRMYGPALLNENPSNGIDLWLKHSPELIVDTFYYRELELGLPYHINWGKGLDCYKVGHTVGCGGMAVLHENEVFVSGPYSTWKILEQTPDKLVFVLGYDSLQVAGQTLKGQVTITTQAGHILNKAEWVIFPPEDIEASNYLASINIDLAGGIFLHDTLENMVTCEKCGMIAYAEDAMSDKNAVKMNAEHGISTDQGRSYIAVVVPGATRQIVLDGNALSAKSYTLGETFTYYFGASWSRWKNGDQSFPTDEDWFNAIRQAAQEL